MYAFPSLEPLSMCAASGLIAACDGINKSDTGWDKSKYGIIGNQSYEK